MGSFMKCFDVAPMVIDEATKQFAPLWKVDNEKLQILKQYCEVIDSLSDEFNGESYDVEVDEINMTITIQLECQDMLIESKNHKYYSLVERAVSFGFSETENGLLNVKFVFPSVWDKI